MPRINRLRVVNIQYDGGRKAYPDVLLDAQGDDLLVVLANGGGKTLLLQLMLQVVIPNATIKNRRIAELLQNQRFTGHVLVEWLLDTPVQDEAGGRSFLLTGFCFTNGQGDTPLRYFNYLHQYDRPNPLDLECMPVFTPDRGSTPYPELLRLLREAVDARLQVFDSRAAYQRELERYHIYAREWDGIQKTNNSEGGVDEYFRTSKTTGRLLENMLIPTVEDVLFQSDQAKGELAEAFHSHRQSLLRLPEIERNLADFQRIRAGSEPVLAVVRNYQAVGQKLQRAEDHLALLWRELSAAQGRLTSQVSALEQEHHQLHTRQRELAWQLDSYDHFLQMLKRQGTNTQQNRQGAKVQRLQGELQTEETRYKELEALRLYGSIVEHEMIIARLEVLIEGKRQSEPQLMQRLETERGRLAFAWRRYQTATEEQLQALATAIDAVGQTIGQDEAQLDTGRQRQQELAGQLGRADNWHEETEGLREYWREKASPAAAADPHATTRQWEDEIARGEQRYRQLQERLAELAPEYRALEEVGRRVAASRSDNQHELRAIAEKMQAHAARDEELTGQLARWEIYVRHLLLERDRAQSELRVLLGSRRDEHTMAMARLFNLEEKLTLVADNDYYTPHQQITRVQKALEARGITALAGARWLREFPDDETRRQGYLWHQPLLPYSLLIDESDLKRCREILTRLGADGGLDPDFPLFLIVHKDATLQEKDGEPGLNPLPGKGTYIFQDNTMAVFTSPLQFETWRGELRQRRDEADRQAQLLAQQTGDLAALERELATFLQTYQPELPTRWRSMVADLEAKAAQLTAEEEAAAARRLTLGKERDRLQGEGASLAEQKHRLLGLVHELGRYRERFAERPAREKERHRLLDEQAALTERLQGLATNVDLARQRLKELEQQHYGMRSDLDRKQAEVAGLLAGVVAESSTDRSLAAMIRVVQGIHDSLRGVAGEIESWREQITRERQEAVDKGNQLTILGIAKEWCQAHQRPVDWSEIRGQQKRVERTKAACTTAQKDLADLDRQLAAMDGALRTLAATLQKEYDRPPYGDFDPHLHAEQQAGRQGQRQGLADQMAAVEGQVKAGQELAEALQRAAHYILEEWPAARHHAERLVVGGELQGEQSADQAAVHDGLDAPLPTWDVIDSGRPDPEEVARRAIRHRRDLLLEQQKLSRTIDDAYRHYEHQLQTTDNPQVRTFARTIAELAGNQRLYDRQYMEETFNHVFEGMAAYERHFREQRANIAADRQQVVERSVQRAQRMIKELIELPRYAIIELYGRETRMIQIDLPTYDPADAMAIMSRYIDNLIAELADRRRAGEEEDALRRVVDDRLTARNVLNALVPLDKCRVRVVKPQKESLMRQQQRLEYEDWDRVAAWSGGEEYGAYMSMFIVLVSYIRQKVSGVHNAWKVILADNPFGKASSPHILEAVFRMGRRNRVQFICLTAHREQAILERFRVVYSLKLVHAYGRELISSEQMESGFYTADVDADGRAQVRLSL